MCVAEKEDSCRQFERKQVAYVSGGKKEAFCADRRGSTGFRKRQVAQPCFCAPRVHGPCATAKTGFPFPVLAHSEDKDTTRRETRQSFGDSYITFYDPDKPDTQMASRQFVRSLATAASTVKPPVQLFGLDGTYATALYTAAAKDSSIEKTFQSVEKLNNAVKEDEKLSEILSNPALSLGSRKEVISTLQSTLKLDKTTVNLLNVLSENNRLSLFPQIAKQFGVLNSAHNGVVEATVVSAKALDSKTIQRLTKAIQGSKFVGQGKTLKITNEVNPDILGGLVVEVGDNTVDLSVSAKVTKLNKVLTEAI